MKGFIKFSISVLCALAITACEAKEPEMVGGLSGMVYNYSQDWIATVKINGKGVGSHSDEAKIGGVEGGGIVCCTEISPTQERVNVTVKTDKGEYTTLGVVELPFPDLMHYLIVHVLPGRKIVIEVTPGDTFPRKDLLDAQIKALRLKKEHEYTGPMRTERPEYTGYYQSK